MLFYFLSYIFLEYILLWRSKVCFILLNWFRCSGTWTNKTRKVRRWGYRLGGENPTEVCEHIFKNKFWFLVLHSWWRKCFFTVHFIQSVPFILDYLQALTPKYDLIWCGTLCTKKVNVNITLIAATQTDIVFFLPTLSHDTFSPNGFIFLNFKIFQICNQRSSINWNWRRSLQGKIHSIKNFKPLKFSWT